MLNITKAAEHSAGEQRIAQVEPLYLKTVTLVERLHRRLLDVIKDEFDRRNRSELNPIQAFLLYNIGEQEVTAGELRTRGYYLGSYGLEHSSKPLHRCRCQPCTPGPLEFTPAFGGPSDRIISHNLVELI